MQNAEFEEEKKEENLTKDFNIDVEKIKKIMSQIELKPPAWATS